jgi:excisionase family DNA binding protein
MARPFEKSPKQQSAELPLFFKPNDIANTLDVSPRTVRRWIKSGKLKAHRFGGAVRISAADFNEFAEAHRQNCRVRGCPPESRDIN